MKYAQATSVPVDQTRSEIERILKRYGATAFMYAQQDQPPQAMIEFIAEGRRVRFVLPLPLRDDAEIVWSPAARRGGQKRKRDESARERFWEQACRQRWRALRISVLAKLEAVESKITTFEDEFLAHIVDPDTGRTVSEVLRPQIAVGYQGRPQALRLGLSPTPPSAEEQG